MGLTIGYNALLKDIGSGMGACVVEQGNFTGVEEKLEDLKALSGDIRSCAVLSEDGELVGARLGDGVERERAAAMLAALSNLSEKVARENSKEHASQTRIKTEDGHVLLARLDDGGVLVATTDPDARVGLVLYDMRNARGEVQKALREEREG